MALRVVVMTCRMLRRVECCLTRGEPMSALCAPNESDLRTDEDQRVRAHVRSCGEARRGEPRSGISRFRLARADPRRGGARAEGGVEPISSVARGDAAA